MIKLNCSLDRFHEFLSAVMNASYKAALPEGTIIVDEIRDTHIDAELAKIEQSLSDIPAPVECGGESYTKAQMQDAFAYGAIFAGQASMDMVTGRRTGMPDRDETIRARDEVIAKLTA